MAKKTKTPQQRAQEQLDVADRKVKRLQKKHLENEAAADKSQEDLSAAITERNAYAELAEKLGPGKQAEVAEVPPMTAEEAE